MGVIRGAKRKILYVFLKKVKVANNKYCLIK